MRWRSVFFLCRANIPVLPVGNEKFHLIDGERCSIFIEDAAFDVERLSGNGDGERGSAAARVGGNGRWWSIRCRSSPAASSPAAATTTTLRAFGRHHRLQRHFERG